MPELSEAAAGKAFAEAADIASWVAEHKPDDLGVGVGQSAFGNFPDDVRNSRAFVEDQQQALAFVVESGEGFGVSPTKGSCRCAKCARAMGPGDQRRGVEGEVISCEPAEIEPLAELGPGLGLELGFSVGGDDSAAVGIGHEGPEGQLGHRCGFGYAVA